MRVALFTTLLLLLVACGSAPSTVVVPSNEHPDTAQVADTTSPTVPFCPDFSGLSDRLHCGADGCWYEVVNERGAGMANGYKLLPQGYRPGDFFSGTGTITCRRGSAIGENAKSFYCDGMYTIIQETDTDGTIRSSREPSVRLVVTDGKIVATLCSDA
jgi:hypothetical protein